MNTKIIQRSAALMLAGYLSLLAGGTACAADRHVRIINSTDETIVRFYASNSSRTSWEEDILGQQTLDPGESANINVDDGSGACIYDFKAVFSDGQSSTRSSINVCKISEFRYTQ